MKRGHPPTPSGVMEAGDKAVRELEIVHADAELWHADFEPRADVPGLFAGPVVGLGLARERADADGLGFEGVMRPTAARPAVTDSLWRKHRRLRGT